MDDFEVNIRRDISIIKNNHQNVLPDKNYTRIEDALDRIDCRIERAKQAKPSGASETHLAQERKERALLASDIQKYVWIIREIYERENESRRVLSDNDREKVAFFLDYIQNRTVEAEERLEEV